MSLHFRSPQSVPAPRRTPQFQSEERLPITPLQIVRLPVGPYQANCYVVFRDGGAEALVVDPGEEPDLILQELAARSLTPLAVLVTHGHLDHVGGVATVAAVSSAPVYMSRDEAFLLERINDHLYPGLGPYEPYQPDHLLDGGEQLQIGPFAIDVLNVPGHSPAHLAFQIEGALFSGDVLFAGSVGRTDLPGGDWAILEASIGRLLDTLPPETLVLPGHGDATTLAAEREGNPFLAFARRL